MKSENAKSTTRQYRQGARAKSMEATRERIVDAALSHFLAHWYDDITLAAIAKDAGVTQQTIINHFGSKEALLAQAIEHFEPERGRRGADGDPAERVVSDYERGADTTIRLLALEERVPALGPILAAGRAGHRAWIEEAFAAALPELDADREAAVSALVVATDVYTWKLLRRDLGLSEQDTVNAMRRLIAGAIGRGMTVAKYLIALQEGGGDSPPFASIARGLVAARHEVTAIADPVLRPEVERAGARFVSWEKAPHKETFNPDEDLARDWEAKSGLAKFKRFRDGIAFGPAAAYAADVAAQIERDRPDVVIATVVGFGAQAAAEAAGVPLVIVLTTSYVIPGTGATPYGSGLEPPTSVLGRVKARIVDRVAMRLWATGGPTLNAVRADLGLEPLAHPLDQVHRADRFLVATSPAFDFPVERLPDNVRYIGPRLDDPAWAGDWQPPTGEEPLVLVGLSSTYMAQEDLFRRVAEALGELPVRGLMTLGPTIDDLGFAVPANVTVVKAAPHAEALRHASVAITHGGHGTTIKALAAGVPTLVLPQGRDQPDNAVRVAASGAGRWLDPSAKPDAIRAAVLDLLNDPSYKAAAERIATAIRAETATDRAVAELVAAA